MKRTFDSVLGNADESATADAGGAQRAKSTTSGEGLQETLSARGGGLAAASLAVEPGGGGGGGGGGAVQSAE